GATAETVAPWRQSKVRLGHPIKLTLGIQSPRVQRPPCRPQPRYPVSCIKVREADENSYLLPVSRRTRPPHQQRVEPGPFGPRSEASAPAWRYGNEWTMTGPAVAVAWPTT